jgi:pilus assembly protein CpaC
MVKWIVWLVLGALIAWIVTPQPAKCNENVALISLQSGHSTILPTPGLQRVAVGDGRIASVIPVGTSQVVITGKAPGHTTVYAWTLAGRLAYEITVTQEQLDDLAQILRTSIDEPNVEVITFNHSIVVRGTVADGGHLQAVNDVVDKFQPYAKREKDVLINVVTVKRPIGDLQRELSSIPGADDVRVDPDGHGNVIVSGHVHDPQTAQAVLDRARGLAGAYLAADGKLIDRIATDVHSQIDVKVYVLEIDKTALSDLGIGLQDAQFQPTGGYILDSSASFPIVESPSAVGSGKGFSILPFFRTITLAPTLNLLITNGDAKMLSSPDLVTVPGNEADFLVGGEVPIPYSSGLGVVSIVYKEYGVKLKVTPTLMGDGSIDSKIEPEVSDLDFQDGVTTGGFVIPALKTSRLSTDVITKPGESIIMGGMLRHIETKNIQKIPLLGDLPILGPLFRSTRYQTEQSDVVFVMTPEVITR